MHVSILRGIGSALLACLKNLSNLQWAQAPIKVNKHTHPHVYFMLQVTEQRRASAAPLPQRPIAVNHRANTGNFRS